MKNPIQRGGALLGALAAVVGGLWLVSQGPSAEAAGPRIKGRAVPGAAVQRGNRPAGVAAAPSVSPVRPAAAAFVESAAVLRARELLQRLQAAVGPRPELPADLERDLLAFLREGGEGRDAFLRMAWDPSVPRLVVGHLQLFLGRIQDSELAGSLLAALDRFAPDHAARTEMARKSSDPALMVADLRAGAPGKEKADRVFRISRETSRLPVVAEFLLETARQDPDEATRLAAYNRLAYAGVGGTKDLLIEVASDSGRSPRERGGALHSLQLCPEPLSSGALVRLYEDSPVEVRPFVATLMAGAGPDRRVDDILIGAVAGQESPQNLRDAAAASIGRRLCSLPREEARDLGDRAATAVRDLPEAASADVLKLLGSGVLRNEPLREAVKDLHRTAPAGSVLQVAIASSPALRMAAGLGSL